MNRNTSVEVFMCVSFTMTNLMKKAIPYIGMIIITLPMIFFTIKFGSNTISNNPEDWIEFGGFYYGMAGLIVTGYIAFLVNRINIKTSRVGLQFAAYKELVTLLTKLTDEIKPMTRTNKEIDELVCETVRRLSHFWQNYLFLFDKLDKKVFIDYETELIKNLNEFRKQPKSWVFGKEGNYGTLIINKTNELLFQVQRNMIK